MDNNQYDLFVFAGEKSGDLHGGHLLRELFSIRPDARVCGVGGPSMREAGLSCMLPMEKFQVMGFVDVFIALPRLMRQFFAVKNYILRTQPPAVLLIDYPGFNLRLAASLRKAGFKGRICHYICPSVWAWGKKRIPQMANTLDMLFSILPFEKSYFSETSLPVHYVGHPLVAAVSNYRRRPLDDFSDGKVLALFPGSRRKELERNLFVQLSAAKKLRDRSGFAIRHLGSA
jgi:lipid-A-disaccharide synthase